MIIIKNISNFFIFKNKAIIFTCILFSFVSAFAQQRFQFSHISTNQGLSNSSVYSIFEDSRGFMWIGTKDGLNRYDGYSFKIFRNNPDDSTSISNNTITGISQDAAGNIWLATRNGINILNIATMQFEHLLFKSTSNSESYNDLNFVFRDKAANMWVGTNGGGLFKVNETTKAYVQFNEQNGELSDNFVISMIQTSPNELWIATLANGITKFSVSANQFTHFTFPPDDVTISTLNKRKFLFQDNAKNIWIGTKGAGAIRYNTANQKFTQISKKSPKFKISNDVVFDFYQDMATNQLWLATDGGGIEILNPETLASVSRISVNETPEGLSTNAVYVLFKDSQGIIWIGTYAGGLNIYHDKFNFKSFRYYPSQPNGLSQKSALCFCEDADNNIWIGTDGGGLNKFNIKDYSFEVFLHNPSQANSISGDVVKSIHCDKQQNIWIGTYNAGLTKYSIKENRFTRYLHSPTNENTISGNSIWSIAEDTDGSLWLAIHDGGLDHFYPDKNIVEHFRSNAKDSSSVSSNNLVEVFIDSKKRIWIGTVNGGLNKFDKNTRQFVHYKQKTGDTTSLFSNDIRVVFEDSKQNIWVGSQGGGLHKYNEQKDNFTHYSTKNGLPNNTIQAIVEDATGHLWLSTNLGVSKFDITTETFQNFDIGDGLQGNEFNENASIKTSSGLILLGGIDGFSIFSPEDIVQNKHLPPVYFTDFKLYDKSIQPNAHGLLPQDISMTDKINLTYKEKVFSIEFAALDFVNPNKNQYKYRLIGFDKEWVDARNKREVSYTNLSPGSYEFQVIASNNDNLWNTEGATLKIIVSPPFWKTKAFVAMVFVLLILGLYLIFKMRLIALRRRQAYLELQVNEKTKEIQNQKEELQTQADDLYHKNTILENQKNEISQQRDKIVEMASREQELNALKLHFFTNVSHELRTPLTLIIGPLEQLQEKDHNAERTSYYDTILRNAKRLQNLINQLMNFRKLESGEIQFNPQKNDLVSCLAQTVKTFSPLALSSNIHFTFESKIATLHTSFDAEKIEIVINNLLSNAFKFTPAQGTIKVTLHINDDKFVIEVADNGIGIPTAEIDKLFNRFYQPEYSHTLNKQGTGIGLSLVKEFVQMHGGIVSVTSTPNESTIFTVAIPIDNDCIVKNEPSTIEFNTPQQIAEDTASELPSLDQTKQQVVLVIDDNEDIRTFIANELVDEYLVLQANDGKEGISKAIEILPDIIICDIMMPFIDGIELSKRLKNNELTYHIPIVLLTAKSSEEYKIEGYQTGADDYITKPFSMKVLRARIKNILENRTKLIDKYKKQSFQFLDNVEMATPDDIFIQKVNEVLLKNIANNLFGTSELGMEMGYSRTQFYRKIMAVTGQAPNEFIRTIRLKEAAKMMKQEGLNVSETAFRTGFSNYSYFSKCFTEYFNITPSDFIARKDI